jgi:hypothetical protein
VHVVFRITRRDDCGQSGNAFAAKLRRSRCARTLHR